MSDQRASFIRTSASSGEIAPLQQFGHQRGNVIVSRRDVVKTSSVINGVAPQQPVSVEPPKIGTTLEAATVPRKSHLQKAPVQHDNVTDKQITQKAQPTASVSPKKLNFQCDLCEKRFRHKSYFDYHLRTHSGERPFQCSHCVKSFFERSKLNRHLSSCHNIKIGIYEDEDGEVEDQLSKTCQQCQKTFSRRSGLEAHMLTHSSSGNSKPFGCSQCDKKFSGLTALKNHEKSHTGTKNILCDLCGKAFLLQKYLNLHLKTTHKNDQRQHQCLRCRKEFYSTKDLKRHQLMHSNKRNFECHLCKTGFKRKDNLNRHLKLTHLVTPDQISDTETASTSSSSSNLQSPPVLNLPSVVTRQVSVIKSTHEVMMSITREQQQSEAYRQSQ